MLTVRDLLSWVAFINMTERSLGPEFAFLHGAFLVLLDGLSLGTFLLCYSSTCPCTFYSLIVNNCIFIFKTVWLSIYFYHFLLMVWIFFICSQVLSHFLLSYVHIFFNVCSGTGISKKDAVELRQRCLHFLLEKLTVCFLLCSCFVTSWYKHYVLFFKEKNKIL